MAYQKVIKVFVAVSLFVALYASTYAASAQLIIERADNFRYQIGEAPDWSAPLYQSDNWQEFDQLTRQDPNKGIFWIKMDVYLTGGPVPEFDWEYNVHMLGSHEGFWDNNRLGQSGVPAQEAENEVPGNVWHTYLIPNHQITPGRHVITIKGSAHARQTGMKLFREGFMRPFTSNWRYVSLWSLIPTLFVSIGLVVGLYFLMLYFTDDRKPEYLMFCILLISLTVYGFAIQWDHLVGYTYDLEWVNLALENIAAILVLLTLPLYFLFKHKAAHPWWWMLATIVVTLIFGNWISPNAANLAWFASFGSALLASIYYGKRNDSLYWWESLGLVACIAALLTQDMEDTFLFLPALFSVVLLTHAIAMRQRKLALDNATNLETQLRAELMRKHIQPHFLLNTLTSLMEWVETDAERGSEFISELAEEFRLMSQLSNQTIVDLGTELEMCDRHLAIMSLRIRKVCRLVRHGISGDEAIPPAIFHTLIENAFSHNAYDSEQVIFEITKEAFQDSSWIRYRLQAPRAAENESNFGKIGTGTGMKYIKSRLKQCFASHWRLRELPQQHSWITEIEVDYANLKHEVTD